MSSTRCGAILSYWLRTLKIRNMVSTDIFVIIDAYCKWDVGSYICGLAVARDKMSEIGINVFGLNQIKFFHSLLWHLKDEFET